MSKRSIICGGLPANRGGDADLVELDIGSSGHAANRINLKIGDLSARMVEDVPLVLADLIEIAAYVYCADQFARRGGDTMAGMGKDWARQFRFKIPVRRFDLWRRPDVLEALCDALSFLSGDEFDFEFAPRTRQQSTGLQPYLDFSDSFDSGFVPDDVILFSGGLDSFAGTTEALLGRGHRVALVSHQASPMIMSKQRHLVAALRDRSDSKQLFHVPVSVNKGREEAVEFTQRTRSFLFASLGLIVARLFRRNIVQFYENGVVSTNLPIAAHVLGSRATRTTHPKVLADLSGLFSLLLDEPITIENPYFWKTKAEVVGVIATNGCADLITDTFSCAQVREATRTQRHCGVCTQCLDRQFGIIGADLEAVEPAEAYAVNLFRGERKPGLEVVTAESYILHAMRLATMTEQALFSSFGQLFRILPYLPGTQTENAARLYDLHRRHGQTVHNAINHQLQRGADVLTNLALPSTSLLALTQSVSVRLSVTHDPTELEAPASERAALDNGPTIDRPILFALDEEHKCVLFDRGIAVKRTAFDLVRALSKEFAEDLASKRARETFRFVSADTLSKRLAVDGQAVRQRIARFRKAIEKKYLAAFDVQLDTNDVIENDRWRGYRLNPWLLRVEPAQLSDSSRLAPDVTAP